MVIALDTTVGGASANSYISLADADTYLEPHPDFSTWDALSDAVKNAHLVQATRILDTEYFEGWKYDESQALQFPRSSQSVVDSYTAVTAIPPNIKNAQCEQAIFLAVHGMSRRDEFRADGVKNLGIGGAGSVNEKLVGSGTPISLCATALAALRFYLLRSARTV